MKDGLPWRVRKAMAAKAAANVRSSPKPTYPRVTPKPSIRRLPPNHNPHKDRNIMPWKHTRIFDGRVVHIVGGGPSLRDPENMSRMRSVAQGRTEDRWIVVNNSYKIAPWADLLHFADASWWEWNGADVLKRWREPKLIVTATSDLGKASHPRLKRMWRDRNDFSLDPQRLHGWDSGTQAVNLAFHLGASKIVLWGIDMQPADDGATQWHNEHKERTRVSNYEKRFRPSLAASVRQLKIEGVPVIRATNPGIPEVPYEPLV